MFKMTARVYENKGQIQGSKVVLSNSKVTLSGIITAESRDEFLVNWEDGARSVENKSNYELIIQASESYDRWIDTYGDDAFEKTSDGQFICKWCRDDEKDPETVVFPKLNQDAEKHFVEVHLPEMDISESDFAEGPAEEEE